MSDIGLLNGDDEEGGEEGWFKRSEKDIKDDPKLSEAQKLLILEIREKFRPMETVTDKCILYEVTKYRDESAEAGFWEQYDEFAELATEDTLVMKSKISAGDAKKVELIEQANSDRRSMMV